MRRRARGFTVVELAIIISISALTVPLCFLFLRTLIARSDLASFELEAATTLRSIHEQVELDRTRAKCEVKWTLEGDALTRTSSADCGGTQVFARGVKSFERVAGGASVQVAKRLSPEQDATRTLFVPGVTP